MNSIKNPFLSSTTNFPPSRQNRSSPKPHRNPRITIVCTITPDPWTLSNGNKAKSKPFKKDPKKRLSDDDARRIINAKAQYLSVLRRNQGSQAQTPKWIRRTPEQMVQYLKDDRDGHIYGKHVVAAIRIVRNLSTRAEGSYNMREVMSSFVTKLTFKEMCIVLKEQKGWRQVRDFFDWMKLQLSYRPSVIVYTIVLRIHGQVGKIKLAEQTFLEMLEAGCEADEVACGTMLCAYARWGRHKAMLSFYSAVQERGIIPSVAVFNFMVSSLQKKSLHREVIHLWRQMVDGRVGPNHFTYTVVICSYTKEGLLREAFETFNEMKKSGFIPEEVTYSLLISLSAKHGNQDEALKLYQEMRSLRIVPSNYTCASLLTLYYKSGDYSKALSLFSEMAKSKIPADEVIYGLLIRIYGKLGLYDDAQKTFEEIEQLGLLSDEKTYVSMAHVHLNTGNFEKALNVLELMKSRKICFSRFAYIVLLQCYAMKEDVGSAEVTFQALFKSGLPDAASCRDMLNLYMRLDLLEKTKAFIVQLRKDQVQFDEDLYKIVMKVYCKNGLLSDAKQLTEEMGQSVFAKDSKFIQTSLMVMYRDSTGLEKAEDGFVALNHPDSMALEMLLSLYFTDGDAAKTRQILKLLLQTPGGLSVASQLISKSIREGDSSKAESLYDQVIKLGYKPEDSAIASMINLYGRLQQLNRVQEVYASVADSPASAKRIYSSMIDAYAKCGKLEEVNWLYEEMVRKGHDLNAVMISMIVNALTTYGKHRMAECIIRKSFQEEVKLDTVAYNTFIKAMLEAGKLHFATSIYDRMLSSGVGPSIQTYNTMISVYGRGRKLDEAIEMFNMARNFCISLDEKAYTNMISYYGKAGKYQEATHLFIQMQEEGIQPGKVSYNIMINVYATVGLDDEAEKFFQDMQRNGCSPDSFTYLALIRAYTESGKYSKAEEIIGEMQKTGISPSCSHFNHLLFAFMRAGLIGDAERVYTELIGAGLSLDTACKRTMLRGYMDYGYIEEGISFFERISESVEPDRFILSAAVHLYKSVGNEIKAGEVMDCMIQLGVSFLENLEVGSKMKAS
ncbi:Pentatricopeptide repeat [Macleaya cordata]|uniref:Pentatricopeptide repeat n=1 Tax=Macleaya cordata TaxID=56857 RepID=A0A200PX66_MACCD|nr:Pentatricopeptide repeat [Macleaya cordata]